MKKLAPPG